MKTILCYGDSNTWGFTPLLQQRYSPDIRWTGVLRAELGVDFMVIEEGMNGRTTLWDDPVRAHRKGLDYLDPCLESHRPLDLVILMLGTNDMKRRFNLPPYDIAEGAGVLVDFILRSEAGPDGKAPKVLLICPPPLGKMSDYAEMFVDAAPKALALPEYYRKIAQLRGCEFLNSGDFVTAGDLDGIHLEPEGHRKLGQMVAARVKEIFS
jgi:lysophospholipase L1-like esterase